MLVPDILSESFRQALSFLPWPISALGVFVLLMGFWYGFFWVGKYVFAYVDYRVSDHARAAGNSPNVYLRMAGDTYERALPILPKLFIAFAAITMLWSPFAYCSIHMRDLPKWETEFVTGWATLWRPFLYPAGRNGFPDFSPLPQRRAVNTPTSSPDADVQADAGFGPSSAGTTGKHTKPSFNCRHAKNWSEKKLCQSDQLADMDVRLAEQYKTLLRSIANVDERREFRNSQRRWLELREACETETNWFGCLKLYYKQRFDQFATRMGHQVSENERAGSGTLASTHCPANDTARTQPIRNIYLAWESLNPHLYAEQWFPNAVQLYGHGRQRMTEEIIHSREAMMQNLSRVDVNKMNIRFMRHTDNDYIYAVEYDMVFFYYNGDALPDRDTEIYQISCDSDSGQWKIKANRDVK